MKKHKRMKRVVICVLVVLVGIGISMIVLLQDITQKTNQIKLHTPNLATIKDGVYEGRYSIFPVSAKVKVYIEDKRINDVKIITHGLGKAAENIVSDVLQKQSLEVDTVSQATISSVCILKAAEQAMEKGE